MKCCSDRGYAKATAKFTHIPPVKIRVGAAAYVILE